jgi:hypothetical protein
MDLAVSFLLLTKIHPEIGIKQSGSIKIKDIWPKTGQYLKIYIKKMENVKE